MNEEEIINKLYILCIHKGNNEDFEALRKLLELYNQEKEKNKELLKKYNKKINADWEDAISKDKIKELLENELINISGFECIAKSDIEELLEEER